MINPGTVVRLLIKAFPVSNVISSRADEQFAEILIAMIKNRQESQIVTFEEEDDLFMENDIEDCELLTMDFDTEADRTSSGSSYEPSPRRHREFTGMEYKKSAVDFWKTGISGRRSFKSVKHRYKLVKLRGELYRWEAQLEKSLQSKAIFPTEKSRALQLQVLGKYREARAMNLIVHDIDLRKWALTANREVQLEGFTASKKWVHGFKSHHRIVSRKITKMVTKRYQEKLDLELAAMDFVHSVLPKIEKDPTTVYNVDQSGFQREMHSGRTLADKGAKRVFARAQSLTSLTHSYTIQPVISADGRLMSPLYVVLQEPSGSFGPKVEQTMLRPPNVFVEASKSGKVSKQHIKSWLENVYFKTTSNNTTLIVGALSQYMDNDNMQCATPDDKELELLRIPPGATGMIQPLDVYFFRPWKAIVRKIEDAALYEGEYTLMHQRDNILKLQSLIHHQFSSPKYKNLIKYAWYNSRISCGKAWKFFNPVKILFSR